jgi:hypothetical protein
MEILRGGLPQAYGWKDVNMKRMNKKEDTESLERFSLFAHNTLRPKIDTESLERFSLFAHNMKRMSSLIL